MKKKIIYFVTVISIVFIFNSCGKNRLDILPLDILSSDQVFADESAINAYMASMYDKMPLEDPTFYGLFHPLSNNTDESLNVNERQRNYLGDGSTQSWWGFSRIRQINDLMARLPKSPLGEGLKKTLMGEAFFIRAYDYFQMVKRYGGVPIIKNVQVFNGANLEELKVLRNKEKEVYDFVATDLDSAALFLPEISEKGKVNKYAALALKSRVMLYAASSAKYAKLQLNGLVGIPASDAKAYWQASMDAAKAVITSAQYSLYTGNANKTENFREMFLLSNNPEAIFSKFFSYPDKAHSYDAFYLPVGIRGPSGFGSNMAPTLDMVEQFEYIDGTSGPLLMGTNTAPIYYSNPLDIYKNRDPRLLATVTVPFSQWRDNVVDIQAGIYDNGVKTESLSFSTLYNPATHQVDNVNGTLHVCGSNGFVSGESTATGFYVRKYMDPSLSQALARTGGSSQPYIEIRYAEVLLNYAEAAMELNNVAEAKEKVNMVRARAGIVLLDDASTTLTRIRHERLVEFAFENQRWWDYRRWRISDQVFNNLWVKAIRPYYDIQAKAYRFEREQAGVYPKTFPPSLYYEMIDPSDITTNEKLIQNPLY